MTAWPTLITRRTPSRQTWQLVAATQVHESTFNGATQTQALSAAVWATSISYDNLSAADAAIMQAFLAGLQGRAGRVTVGNLAAPRIRGTAVAVPTIKIRGSGQTGAAVNIDGINPGTGVKAGDLFGLESRLYMFTADGTADGLGQINGIAISPPLRSSPAANAPLTMTSPTTTMRLMDDRQGWDYAPGSRRSFTVDLVEVL